MGMEPEGQQQGLRERLVDVPAARAIRLGHAGLAAVGQSDSLVNGLADFGIGRGYRLAAFPGCFDGLFEFDRHHGSVGSAGLHSNLLAVAGRGSNPNAPRNPCLLSTERSAGANFTVRARAPNCPKRSAKLGPDRQSVV